MKIFKQILLVAVASMPACAQSTVCTTHFSNRSNFEWSLFNVDGQKTYLKIPPNTTIDIPWGATTSIIVSGNITNRPYLKQFGVQPAGSCVSIQSQGNPGAVILNKPNNGDIATCAGNCSNN